MHRTPLLLAAVLGLTTCDSGAPGSTSVRPRHDADPPAPAADASAPVRAPPPDPWQATLDARILAPSGIGVEGRLLGFEILDARTGEQFCQISRLEGRPKVMAVGAIDDEAFHEDLKDLDAVAHKYGLDRLPTFAVLIDAITDSASTPRDPQALRTRAAALADQLGISIAVVVPVPTGNGRNEIWDAYYNITRSRTVMFADGNDDVRFSGVAPPDWSELNEAIVAVLDAAEPGT